MTELCPFLLVLHVYVLKKNRKKDHITADAVTAELQCVNVCRGKAALMTSMAHKGFSFF